MANTMGGANIGAKARMRTKIVNNVSDLSTDELKKELLWLKSYDTDWSKEISRLIKEELSIRDTQAESKDHIVS
jgi:hypothetical protein